MRVLDTDEVKHFLYSTKVVAYKEEIQESRTVGTSISHGTCKGSGGGSFQGVSAGEGIGGSDSAEAAAEIWNSYVADSSGESESWSSSEFDRETQSESVTTSTRLVPVLGKEVSSVQFRSIEEQLFRATQTLFDQEDRHFAVRFQGGPKAPLFVKMPS